MTIGFSVAIAIAQRVLVGSLASINVYSPRVLSGYHVSNRIMPEVICRSYLFTYDKRLFKMQKDTYHMIALRSDSVDIMNWGISGFGIWWAARSSALIIKVYVFRQLLKLSLNIRIHSGSCPSKSHYKYYGLIKEAPSLCIHTCLCE